MILNKKFPALLALILGFWTAAGSAPAPPGPFESTTPLTPQSEIDRAVFAHLAKLGLEPARLCSDAVFVRRIYLDVIGTLPTLQEARDFLADTRPDKRRVLIDSLLQRDEFADRWAMKWCDILRVKAEFPINLWPNAVQAYHRWIRTSIKENMPYDRFARALLTSSGSNFRVGPVNFYRAMQNREPQGIAQVVALTFMGERTEKWPKERLAGLAAFFANVGYKYTGEWKEEIVYFNPEKGGGPAAQKAIFPDGTAARLTADRDPREVFADWLIDPKNPSFARNIVNRAWSWLQGRGVIHEPDDFRPDNPPSNPELLACLERELTGAKWDMKQLFRSILNSKAYQLSSIPQSDKPEAEANFAFYPLRRIEAEVLIDALNQITGSTDLYSSMIPEPFTYIPEDLRSIALPDGSITSSFLEMFGRPPRDTGQETERVNKPTAQQRLHLLNSSHVQRKIEQSPNLLRLLSQGGNPRQVIPKVYLTILSRPPTEEEIRTVEQYSGTGSSLRKDALTDLVWALINSPEFLYRH